jgi:PhnB protein
MPTTLAPYLVVDGAAQAIAFYARAFGAKETMRLAEPGGRIGPPRSRSATRSSCSRTSIRR